MLETSSGSSGAVAAAWNSVAFRNSEAVAAAWNSVAFRKLSTAMAGEGRRIGAGRFMRAAPMPLRKDGGRPGLPGCLLDGGMPPAAIALVHGFAASGFWENSVPGTRIE